MTNSILFSRRRGGLLGKYRRKSCWTESAWNPLKIENLAWLKYLRQVMRRFIIWIMKANYSIKLSLSNGSIPVRSWYESKSQSWSQIYRNRPRSETWILSFKFLKLSQVKQKGPKKWKKMLKKCLKGLYSRLRFKSKTNLSLQSKKRGFLILHISYR